MSQAVNDVDKPDSLIDRAGLTFCGARGTISAWGPLYPPPLRLKRNHFVFQTSVNSTIFLNIYFVAQFCSLFICKFVLQSAGPSKAQGPQKRGALKSAGPSKAQGPQKRGALKSAGPSKAQGPQKRRALKSAGPSKARGPQKRWALKNAEPSRPQHMRLLPLG